MAIGRTTGGAMAAMHMEGTDGIAVVNIMHTGEVEEEITPVRGTMAEVLSDIIAMKEVPIEIRLTKGVITEVLIDIILSPGNMAEVLNGLKVGTASKTKHLVICKRLTGMATC
jgi:hypothetical protein